MSEEMQGAVAVLVITAVAYLFFTAAAVTMFQGV
jgi:hypothetical protein